MKNWISWCGLSLVLVCIVSPSWAILPRVQFTTELTSEDLEECKECDLEKCPAVTRCNVGIVRDKCGCCDVCGLEEGHLCNMHEFEPRRPWYGSCGVNLECRQRTDIDRNLVGNQSICYCIKEGKVCASNSQTYSVCQMQAMEMETDKEIHMISRGYCKTEPKIITIAESQTVDKGSKVSFLCEVMGFPLPTVFWYFTPPGSQDTQKLPGDSDEISVTFRGGPQAKRITSHLQITNFMLKNEGKYQCFADNDMGMVTKEFRLVIKQ